jgi:hypothetical protein
VPATLRETWADAVHRWLGITEQRVLLLDDKATRSCLTKAPGTLGIDLVIASYNQLLMADIGPRLQSHQFQVRATLSACTNGVCVLLQVHYNKGNK